MLWILGAPDPEMAAIEQLLSDSGQRVVHAATGRRRASAESAYAADSTLPPLTRPTEAVFVECQVEGFTPVAVIDHHRPMDPGYRVPPEEFLRGASIGQVLSFLARHNLLPLSRPWVSPHPVGSSLAAPGSLRFTATHGWLLCASASRFSEPSWYQVAPKVVLIAAADHCLPAAYRGRCPGVDPDELMKWRVSTRARYQGRSVEDVLANVTRAREALRRAPRVLIGGVPVADLRGQEVPELPEAAAREGVPFLGTPRVPPGARRKVVLQCAPPEALKAWPEWARENGIGDVYGGDPERGFAGGYL